MMISHLDIIIDKNTIPDLPCVIADLTLNQDILFLVLIEPISQNLDLIFSFPNITISAGM